MADITPTGAVLSYAGTVISSLANIADKSVVSTDPQGQIEAYEALLGQPLFVDLFNSTNAPRKDVVTCTVLVRASSSVPITAWQQVRDGVRLLQGLPEQGLLVCYEDTSATTTVSCQARRKRFPITFTGSAAWLYVVTLTWTCTTPWV